MRTNLLFVAYGYLFWAGVLHFLIEVVLPHLDGRLAPGASATLYYGLHSAFAFGQAAFGLTALLVVRSGSRFMERRTGQTIGLASVVGWLIFACIFIDYVQPRMHMAIVLVLLVCAACSRKQQTRSEEGCGRGLLWRRECAVASAQRK